MLLSVLKRWLSVSATLAIGKVEIAMTINMSGMSVQFRSAGGMLTVQPTTPSLVRSPSISGQRRKRRSKGGAASSSTETTLEEMLREDASFFSDPSESELQLSGSSGASIPSG